jgi:hypothetical protein
MFKKLCFFSKRLGFEGRRGGRDVHGGRHISPRAIHLNNRFGFFSSLNMQPK